MKGYEKFISKEAAAKIHEATLRIFRDTGVQFENDKAIEIFKEHGVKTDGYRVYIDEATVEKALKTLPSTFDVRITADKTVTFGKDAQLRMPIAHPAFYCNEKGEIKKMNTEYALRQFKMNESCSITNCSMANLAILYDAKPTKEQMIFGTAAIRYMFSNKWHVGTGEYTNGLTPEEAYKASVDGLELMRRFKGIEPGTGTYAVSGINPLSPLTFDNIPLSRLMASSEHNLPMLIAPCAMPILTAPPSLAGLLAQTNAEVLAAMVFMQLINPGLPAVYANVSGATDMRTLQLCLGSPETALIGYAAAAMADFYHVPFRMGGGMGDSKQVDAQAGAESFMMLYATYDCKPDYALHTAGCMGAMNVFSCEKYILDEEVANYVQRMLRGVNVTDKTLCEKEIAETGPRGTYLKGRTPKVYREDFYLSQLFDKDDPNNWQNNGAKTILEKAHEEADRRIAAYTPPALDKEQIELLTPYVPARFLKEF